MGKNKENMKFLLKVRALIIVQLYYCLKYTNVSIENAVVHFAQNTHVVKINCFTSSLVLLV